MKKPLYLGTFCIGTTPRIPTNSLLVRLAPVFHVIYCISFLKKRHSALRTFSAEKPSKLGKNQPFSHLNEPISVTFIAQVAKYWLL